MKPVFPTIGEYNQLFQKLGGSAFRSLKGIELVPSRTQPIKVFLFGSGAYAAVFKGIYEGKTYAIRCFLTAEDGAIERYRAICNHLGTVQDDWITDSEFLKDEVKVGDLTFPILKMEWVEGLLINQFIDQNLSNIKVLEEIQRQLVAISNSLEKNSVGHGDLQCGNIIVTGSSSKFQIRLIDYDGMYVPELAQKTSIELGRSEFQHPKRTKFDFHPEMDRFSIWVMLTALEALKYDKNLWLEVMQGGFNTLDNFLFSIQDFKNQENSKLFNRLFAINSTSLNYYLNELKSCCVKDISLVTKPILFKQTNNDGRIPEGHEKYTPVKNKNAPKKSPIQEPVRNDMFKIISNNGEVTVLTSTFQKLGTTPLELEKVAFKGKTLIVSNGNTVKQIQLNSEMNLIEVNLGEAINTKAKKETKVSKKKIEPIAQEEVLEDQDKSRTQDREKKERENEKEQRETIIQEELLFEIRKKERERLELEKSLIDKRTKKEKAKNQTKEELNVVYFFLIIFAIFLLGIYVYMKNRNSSTDNIETYENTITETTVPLDSVHVGNLHDVVRDFLEAEDSRDFERISFFMSPNIRRYYDSKNPLIANLKRRYENVWSYTSNSRNSIYGIYKTDDFTYDLVTIYTYSDNTKEKSFSIRSKIRFIFDSNKKILETYSLESAPIEESDNVDSSENTIDKYDFIGSYHEGRALVRVNDKYGYIDEVGREVIPIQYDSASDFSGGYAYVTNAYGGKYINNTGSFTNIENSEIQNEEVVKKSSWASKYSYVGPLSDGLILVFANDKYGYVNVNGRQIIALDYEYAENFQNGEAKVRYNGRDIVINKDGNFVNSSLRSSSTNSSQKSTSNSYNNGTYNATYKYVTSFDDPAWEIPLRNEGMKEIYKCPKDSKVYVIDNSGKTYYWVYVDGFEGWLTKHYLKRKS
jgi:hypothetical protein